MNPNYSNDPEKIGQYYSNVNMLVNSENRLTNVNAFSNQPPLVDERPRQEEEIMTVKPRSSVPDQFISVGTKIGKSCNLPGVNIDRFEMANSAIQDPMHIIANEPFRGGAPSRIVAKDEYVRTMNKN